MSFDSKRQEAPRRLAAKTSASLQFPVIYTPTEAEAISSYSHIFRKSEGLFLSVPHEDRMEEAFLSAVGDRKLGLVSEETRWAPVTMHPNNYRSRSSFRMVKLSLALGTKVPEVLESRQPNLLYTLWRLGLIPPKHCLSAWTSGLTIRNCSMILYTW